jgi:hypothetical protein
VVAAASLMLSLIVGAHAAFGLARFRFTGQSLLLVGLLATSMIPGIAILVPLYDLAVKTGLYNSLFGLILVYTAWNVPILVRLLIGGIGRPEGLDRGYYVRPTVFADVTPDMTIAREEIFGPVLSISRYEDEEEAIRIANDSVYGLAAYVQSGNPDAARAVASRLRAGVVYVNDPAPDLRAPFGGYKQSGNGRECGEFGLDEFLEKKAVIGYGA